MDEKNKKFSVEVKDGKLEMGLDPNQDGEKVVDIKLNLTEGLQEIIARGGKVEGAKLVDFSFELTKLKLKLDTDRDGEEVLDITIDLGEAFDEVSSAVSKKKSE